MGATKKKKTLKAEKMTNVSLSSEQPIDLALAPYQKIKRLQFH